MPAEQLGEPERESREYMSWVVRNQALKIHVRNRVIASVSADSDLGVESKSTSSPFAFHGLFKAAFYTVVSKLIGSPPT